MHPAIVPVDDSPVTLALIRRILQEAVPDYEVVSIKNGATALTLLAQRPVALVITDQHMPDMDGIVLAGAIKATVPQCPIILTSGSAGSEMEQRATPAGVASLLPKPFNFEQPATADWLGTISYEVLTSIAARVPRQYCALGRPSAPFYEW